MGTLIIIVGIVCSISVTVAIETVYMQNKCSRYSSTQYITTSELIRLKATASSEYNADIDCTYTVSSVGSGSHLMIQFKDLSIQYSDDCKDDWLKVYDGDSTSSYLTIGGEKLCGYSTPDRIYTTSGDAATFQFHSDDFIQSSGFDIIITPYRTGYCYSWQISCDNGRCIDDSFRCNGFNPCGDHSDCSLTAAAIAGICVGAVGFVVIIVIISVVVCIRRQRRLQSRVPVAYPAVTTFSATGVQMTQQPPPYPLAAPTGYNPQVGPQVGYVVHQPNVYMAGIASPPQPMTSHPPKTDEAPPQ